MDCSNDSYSSLDTVKLFCEHNTTRRCRRHRHKCDNKKKKYCCTKHNRSVSRDLHRERHISQEISVQKQKYQCIINLKTTVCNHNLIHKRPDEKSTDSQLKNELIRSKSSTLSNIVIKERIVPNCARKSCPPCRNSFNRRRQLKNDENVRVNHHHNRSNSYKNNKDQRKSDYSHRDAHRFSRTEKKVTTELLSPISSSPLKECVENNLTYEDISTDSLDSLGDRQVSCKHKHCGQMKKHCKHAHRRCRHSSDHVRQCKHKKSNRKEHESKLDSLIRRTKERERKQVEKSRSMHMPRCSTPLDNAMSPDEYAIDNMNSSDMDISFVSKSTLVIDAQGRYSNILESPLHLKTEKFNYDAYTFSPTFLREDFHQKYPVYNNIIDIKSEPMMDIEAYSPIQSPRNFLSDFKQEWDKKEVLKSEPQSSPKLDLKDVEIKTEKLIGF